MLPTSEPGAITKAAPSKVILVVEDDDANAEVLMRVLVQETRYLVHVAPDARVALQLISQITPDLFILNYRLPTMTGIELYDALHAHPRFKQTPALILSACLEQYHEEIKSHKLLALSKPFGVDELLSLIAAVFDHASACSSQLPVLPVVSS
jgi:DNA-binding response OmpR family regulator